MYYPWPNLTAIFMNDCLLVPDSNCLTANASNNVLPKEVRLSDPIMDCGVEVGGAVGKSRDWGL